MRASEPTIRFESGLEVFDRCHDLAVETLCRNIKPWQDGLRFIDDLKKHGHQLDHVKMIRIK